MILSRRGLEIDPIVEKNASTVHFELFGQNDNPDTPDSVQYRIDEPISETQVADWDDASFTDNEVDIDVTADQNTIINADGNDEQREITIRAMYSGEAFYAIAYYNLFASPFI